MNGDRLPKVMSQTRARSLALRRPSSSTVNRSRKPSRALQMLALSLSSLSQLLCADEDPECRSMAAVEGELRRNWADGAAVPAVVRAVRGLPPTARHVRGEGGGGPLRRQPARHARALPGKLRRVPAAPRGGATRAWRCRRRCGAGWWRAARRGARSASCRRRRRRPARRRLCVRVARFLQLRAATATASASSRSRGTAARWSTRGRRSSPTGRRRSSSRRARARWRPTCAAATRTRRAPRASCAACTLARRSARPVLGVPRDGERRRARAAADGGARRPAARGARVGAQAPRHGVRRARAATRSRWARRARASTPSASPS